MTYATYFESFDVKELLQQFPLDQAFTDKFKTISREELRAEQNAMFLRLADSVLSAPVGQCRHQAWRYPEPG
jgi:phenylacetate-CoA ligase